MTYSYWNLMHSLRHRNHRLLALLAHTSFSSFLKYTCGVDRTSGRAFPTHGSGMCTWRASGDSAACLGLVGTGAVQRRTGERISNAPNRKPLILLLFFVYKGKKVSEVYVFCESFLFYFFLCCQFERVGKAESIMVCILILLSLLFI